MAGTVCLASVVLASVSVLPESAAIYVGGPAACSRCRAAAMLGLASAVATVDRSHSACSHAAIYVGLAVPACHAGTASSSRTAATV